MVRVGELSEVALGKGPPGPLMGQTVENFPFQKYQTTIKMYNFVFMAERIINGVNCRLADPQAQGLPGAVGRGVHEEGGEVVPAQAAVRLLEVHEPHLTARYKHKGAELSALCWTMHVAEREITSKFTRKKT